MTHKRVVFRGTLFVTGGAPETARALENIEHFFKETVSEPYRLTVVDVQEQPELAEKAHILATPTLVMDEPVPGCRIVGDLSDRRELLTELRLMRRHGA